jgi:hypothetical protein
VPWQIDRQGVGNNDEVGAAGAGAEVYIDNANSTHRAGIGADIQGFDHSRATASEVIHDQGNCGTSSKSRTKGKKNQTRKIMSETHLEMPLDNKG